MPETGKIIIAGGNGFLGKALVKEIINEAEIVLHPNRFEFDLLNKDSIKHYLQQYHAEKIKLVIAAACTPYSVTPADQPEKMMENSTMIENLVEVISEYNINPERIIYLSTIDVYKETNETITEDAAKEPETYYGAAKLAAESFLEVYATKKNVPVALLRLSQVYGPGDNSPKFIPSVIASAVKEKRISLHGDGKLYRDFIYINDVTNIIIHFIKTAQPLQGAFNLSTGHSCSLYEAAMIVKEIIPAAEIEMSKATDKKPVNYFIANDRLKNIFPFQFTDLATGLRQTIAAAMHEQII